LEVGTNLQQSSLKNSTKEIKNFIVNDLSNIEEILTFIKNNPAIICLNGCKQHLKQRVIDIITGAIYMLEKNICPLDKDNYLIIKK
jgi:hypothetical protein